MEQSTARLRSSTCVAKLVAMLAPWPDVSHAISMATEVDERRLWILVADELSTYHQRQYGPQGLGMGYAWRRQQLMGVRVPATKRLQPLYLQAELYALQVCAQQQETARQHM